MILESLLVFGTIFLFESWIKYLFIVCFICYLLVDNYVKHIINSDSYISIMVDADEFDEVEYNNYKPKAECFNGITKCVLGDIKKINLFYKVTKTILDPFEYVYRKSEKFYIPQIIYKIDLFIWLVITIIRDLICSTYIYKTISNRVKIYTTKKLLNCMTFMINNLPKEQMSNKDKKKLIKLTNKAGTKEVTDDELLKIIKTLGGSEKIDDILKKYS
jgi:hypothetical protein